MAFAYCNFFLTLGFAYIKNSHVRIEIIREKYSSILKSIFEILGILIFSYSLHFYDNLLWF